jgi:cytochrome c553
MHERFALVTAARRALQADDLTAAKAHATSIVELPMPEGVVEPWRPFAAELRSDAALLAQATDRHDAARRVAAVAISCASCHQARGGGPARPESAQLDDRQAGLELLWWSLLTGSDDGWQAGVQRLSGPEQPPWALVEASDEQARAEAFANWLVQ